MNKIFVIMFCSMSICILSKAQNFKKGESIKKNNFSIGGLQANTFSDMIIRRVPCQTPQFSYTRSFNKKLGAKVTYSFWRKVHMDLYQPVIEELDWTDTANVGKIYAREQFRYLDFEFKYTFNFFKSHHLSLSAGPSYASSLNTTTKWLSYMYYTEYDGTIRPHLLGSDFTYIRELYLGAVFGLSYQYDFFKGRLSTGAEIKGRYYSDVTFHALYGLNIGYNF